MQLNFSIMKTFDELLNDAAALKDARTKAYASLKALAPGYIRKYCRAMVGMGYKNSFFSEKLFLDQREFMGEYCENDSFLKLDLKKEVFIEAVGLGDSVSITSADYSGDTYEIDFSKNTSGVALFSVLRTLEMNLKNCIEKSQREVENVTSLIDVIKG